MTNERHTLWRLYDASLKNIKAGGTLSWVLENDFTISHSELVDVFLPSHRTSNFICIFTMIYHLQLSNS
jgi:hypothetical protein